MKRIIIIFTIAFISSGITLAGSVRVEFKGGYFNSSDSAIRDIYGRGVSFGSEITISVWKGLEVWAGGGYFSRKGGMTYTNDEIEIKIMPISGGLRYTLALSEVFSLYTGAGVSYFIYNEVIPPLEDINDNNIGFVVKAGGILKISKVLFFNLFVDYSSCTVRPADYDVNIGGLSAGIGIGFEFGKARETAGEVLLDK